MQKPCLALGSAPPQCAILLYVMHVCYPSILHAEVGRLQVQHIEHSCLKINWNMNKFDKRYTRSLKKKSQNVDDERQ